MPNTLEHSRVDVGKTLLAVKTRLKNRECSASPPILRVKYQSGAS
jgi:hypothetical protein